MAYSINTEKKWNLITIWWISGLFLYINSFSLSWTNRHFKGNLIRDFRLQVFSRISFPLASEYPIGNISNFYENSWRYSQSCVNRRCQHQRLTFTFEYLRKFRKHSKWPPWYTQEPGGNWFMKKTWSQKSRVRLPLRSLDWFSLLFIEKKVRVSPTRLLKSSSFSVCIYPVNL